MQKCINEVFNYLVEDAQWEKLNRHNNNWSGDLVFKDYHKLGNKQKEEPINKIKVDEPLSLDFITNPNKDK